jgi:class 3 adenylate cyclase
MAETPALQPGRKLGRFQILEAIGQDALGRTYLAEDTRFGVKVSLRLFPPALAQSPAMAALGQDILKARAVSHPGLSRIFDLHDEAEHTFLTQEQVAGPSLARLLAESVLPPERYLSILARACDAIQAIHQAGQSHGGLTPSSLAVRAKDQPVITDFGLGGIRLRWFEGEHHPLELLLWLAPESAAGKTPSASGDVYAIGAMLYRCITGKPPYSGRDSAEVFRSLLAGKLVPPRFFNPDVPPDLERAVLAALATDPSRRPDIRALAESLRPLLPVSAQAGRPTPLSNPIAAKSASDEPLDEREDHTQEIPWRDKTILMSDIVGITAYFDTHGDMAGRRRIQRHNELLFPIIQRQRGTVVKTIGDAILATFDSADEAVRAAVNMQLAIQNLNRPITDAGERLQIRIGCNSGQCIVEAQDVFGDAVNVAARVCSKAGADQILISAATRGQLKALKVPMVFFSRTSLKGKEEEFDLFLVGWDPEKPLPAEKREMGPAEGPATREMAAAPRASPVESHIPTVTMPAYEGKADPARFPFDLPDLSESLRSPAPPTRRSLTDEIQALTLPGEVVPDEPGSQSGPQPALGSDVKTISIADPNLATVLPAQALKVDKQRRTRPAQKRPRLTVILLSLVLAAALVWIGILVFAGLQPTPAPSAPPLADASTHAEPQPESAEEPTPPAPAPDAGAEETPDAGMLRPASDATPPAAEAKSETGEKPARPKPGDARRRLLQSIRRKGIIPGDLPELDQDIERLARIEKSAPAAELMSIYQHAQALVDASPVGKAFVESKLLRFNRVFDRLSAAAGTAQNSAVFEDITQLLQEVDRAMSSGKYADANRQLNRAFEIIRKIR